MTDTKNDLVKALEALLALPQNWRGTAYTTVALEQQEATAREQALEALKQHREAEAQEEAR